MNKQQSQICEKLVLIKSDQNKTNLHVQPRTANSSCLQNYVQKHHSESKLSLNWLKCRVISVKIQW